MIALPLRPVTANLRERPSSRTSSVVIAEQDRTSSRYDRDDAVHRYSVPATGSLGSFCLVSPYLLF